MYTRRETELIRTQTLVNGMEWNETSCATPPFENQMKTNVRVSEHALGLNESTNHHDSIWVIFDAEIMFSIGNNPKFASNETG